MDELELATARAIVYRGLYLKAYSAWDRQYPDDDAYLEMVETKSEYFEALALTYRLTNLGESLHGALEITDDEFRVKVLGEDNG